MKKIMKYIGPCVLSLAFFITASAQNKNTSKTPDPEDIVCVQVGENVFDCYMRKDLDEGGNPKGHVNDGRFHEGSPPESQKDSVLKKDKLPREEDTKNSPNDSIKDKDEEQTIKAKFLD